MIKSYLKAFNERQRFQELGLDRWRADSGLMTPAEAMELRRRERRFVALKAIKGVVLLPITVTRFVNHLIGLLADIERLHGAPRRRMSIGRGCVLDRETWLVNGVNIALGNYVKVSAYSALIAGYEAKISIGDYTILGPGVFVVAANHGTANSDVPIRYQSWKERSVNIGDDVWVGANVVILPGTQIGDGSIIGAGTVLSGLIPPGVIVYSEKGDLKMRKRQ